MSETIKNSDLQNVSVDIAEVAMDSILKDGLLRDLPIVNSILGIGKTAITIRDYLFLKKIIVFLSEIKETSVEKRWKMIDYVNSDQKQEVKVGEKLMYVLDKCDDHIDARLIAKFFCAFLEEKNNL